MEPERTGSKRWLTQLWSDARQGVVVGIAWVAAAAIAVGLIGVLAGDVPAWTLPVAFVLGMLVPSLALSALPRSFDKQSGAFEEVRRQLRESEARVQTVEAERDALRDRHAGTVVVDESRVSHRAQGFIRRLQALRESAERNMERSPSGRSSARVSGA